ncbi:MAG: hypothetical protein LQ351_004124 [Letrouitia transgressa]|nr:MAG: hypothetical protein LQ351_004124 [Letrouitia transgressa]
MAPYKEDQVVIIVPGSQTTCAQLGLPESFTPARLQIPSRMFPAEEKGKWEPHLIRERPMPKAKVANEDASMTDGDGPAIEDEVENVEDALYEDLLSDEGAIYPIRAGRIVNWGCFFALMTYVHNKLSPPLHAPILVVSQPAWTREDHVAITKFFFQTFQTPGLCIMDAAAAAMYAFKMTTATVVDVGYEKCDITAVVDSWPEGRVTTLDGCGGEAMTGRLLQLLGSRGFTRDMCEQLKRSGICEILPPDAPLPGESEGSEPVVNPAAAASTGANNPGIRGPKGPSGTDANDGDQDREVKEAEDNEGVLDVASIVASGKTSEFVAKREKEKAEKAAKAGAKKAAAEAITTPKQAKLPNSKRVTAIFHYNEQRTLEDLYGNGEQSTNERPSNDNSIAGGPLEVGQTADSSPTSRKGEKIHTAEGTAFIRRDYEVGIERFQAASGIIGRIADAIYRCIQSVSTEGTNRRQVLWDHLIIVGCGSKVKGFKEALIADMNARYLISPSSATIFTSELPSDFTTPVATGANTPQPQSHIANSHHGGGVNPLLLAATTASNPGGLAPPGQSHQHLQAQLQMQQYQQNHPHHQSNTHAGHAQTPTSIKMVELPGYFPEWKDVGSEGAIFLGAQVGAKQVFIIDHAMGVYMSRSDYNDFGPNATHQYGIK